MAFIAATTREAAEAAAAKGLNMVAIHPDAEVPIAFEVDKSGKVPETVTLIGAAPGSRLGAIRMNVYAFYI